MPPRSALHVDGYELTGLELAVSERFTRLTTVITLHGAGRRGVGEDTTYAPPDQLGFCSAGAVLPLAGDWSLDTFSAALEQMNHGRYLRSIWPAARPQSARAFLRRSTRMAGHLHRPVTSSGT